MKRFRGVMDEADICKFDGVLASILKQYSEANESERARWEQNLDAMCDYAFEDGNPSDPAYHDPRQD